RDVGVSDAGNLLLRALELPRPVLKDVAKRSDQRVSLTGASARLKNEARPVVEAVFQRLPCGGRCGLGWIGLGGLAHGASPEVGVSLSPSITFAACASATSAMPGSATAVLLVASQRMPSA